jgi:hypothetical protein
VNVGAQQMMLRTRNVPGSAIVPGICPLAVTNPGAFVGAAPVHPAEVADLQFPGPLPARTSDWPEALRSKTLSDSIPATVQPSIC